MTNDADLRAQMKNLRRGISPRQRCLDETAVWKHLRTHPYLRHRTVVFSYVSTPDEAGTGFINAWLLSCGHDLMLPVTDRQHQGLMRFYRVAALHRLRSGQYGIPEPLPEGAEVLPAPGSVMLVPLVAYDGHGRRLGMGGGYYDRYLRRHLGLFRSVGLAFFCQKVSKLSAAAWDIPLDEVITEHGREVFA